MYGVEWLIGLALLGGLVGLGGGYLLAGRNGNNRHRDLETQLDSARQALDAARRELDDYRQEVVQQFSETARKFQTLNDSYTDLHEQLARSSSVLCGDITGPLLQAPAGHQDLIPAEVRERTARADSAADADRAEPPAADSAAADSAAADRNDTTQPVTDPYDDAADSAEIRVAEPVGAVAEAAPATQQESPAETSDATATEQDSPSRASDAGTPRTASGH